MRTTVDLDANLLKRLRVAAHRRGITVKELLAVLLKRGLDSPPAPPKPYRLRTYHMGSSIPDSALNKALYLADDLEESEIARKIRMRK